MAYKKPKKSVEEYLVQMQSYYDDWADFLGVSQQWAIDIRIKNNKDMDGDEGAAEITWPTNYTTGLIRVRKEWLVKSQPDDYDLEMTIVHEIGHIVNQESWDFICSNFSGDLRKALIAVEEKTVDKWTHIVMRARGAISERVEEESNGDVS